MSAGGGMDSLLPSYVHWVQKRSLLQPSKLVAEAWLALLPSCISEQPSPWKGREDAFHGEAAGSHMLAVASRYSKTLISHSNRSRSIALSPSGSSASPPSLVPSPSLRPSSLAAPVHSTACSLPASTTYHRYITLPASPDRLLSTLQSFKGLTALPNLAAAIASFPVHLRLRQTPPSFPPFRPKVRPCPWQRPPPFPQPPLAKGQAASVEAAIALLKVRWKILRNLNVGLDHAAQTVVACVVLHNMCQFTKGPEDEGRYMWRDSLESPQLASLVDSERSLNYLGESLREALAEDLYEEACLRSKVNIVQPTGASFIGPIASCNLIGDSVATP
ncbi:uncharacterized protein LOC135625824 [Musa acuminata AAA Group]|uniref:uncharacterized protein LOC135625824 n=1 Tax=Musa acuminata AAA Group TaxID=214697 RepID=UPI0031D2A63D